MGYDHMNSIVLKALIDDHEVYHSDLQMDRFIVGKSGGTDFGMYKQALRELHKRYRGLKELYYNRDKLTVEIDEMDDGKNVPMEQYAARLHAIEINRKRMGMEDLNLNILHTEREFKRFFAQAVALKERVGELTPETRAKLDLDMWVHRAKEGAAFDLLVNGRIGPGTMEMVHSLPPTAKRELLITLKSEQKQKELVKWYEGFDAAVPEIAEIEEQSIAGLLEHK